MGIGSVAGTPQLLTAAPTQTGIPVAASQAIGAYTAGQAVAGFAAVAPTAITQAPAIAGAATPATYLTTQLQPQVTERF